MTVRGPPAVCYIFVLAIARNAIMMALGLNIVTSHMREYVMIHQKTWIR